MYTYVGMCVLCAVFCMCRENRIGVNGATALAKALSSNDGLKVLKVSNSTYVSTNAIVMHTHVRTYIQYTSRYIKCIHTYVRTYMCIICQYP